MLHLAASVMVLLLLSQVTAVVGLIPACRKMMTPCNYHNSWKASTVCSRLCKARGYSDGQCETDSNCLETVERYRCQCGQVLGWNFDAAFLNFLYTAIAVSKISEDGFNLITIPTD